MIDALRALLRPLLPYIGVFVSWLLHEISDRFRQSREDRRLAGKVLAELLELRHHMLVLPTFAIGSYEVAPFFTSPNEDTPAFTTVLSNWSMFLNPETRPASTRAPRNPTFR